VDPDPGDIPITRRARNHNDPAAVVETVHVRNRVVDWLGARAPRTEPGDPLQGLLNRGLYTAVAGDAHPLMRLLCLSKCLTSRLATFWFVAPSAPFWFGLEVFDKRRRPKPRFRRLP
jgi:hypothetical protein